MNHGLELQQKIRLHKQLILRLKLLSLTAVELETVVRKELEENPVLEEAEGIDVELADGQVPEEQGREMPESEGGSLGLISETEEGPGLETPESTEFLALLDSEDYHPTPRAEPGRGPDTDQFELTPAEEPGLAEALLPSLRAELSPAEAKVAEAVLQSLDADGFLPTTLEELAEAHRFDSEMVQAVVERIQQVEPGGIACCCLSDALLVQLELHGHPPDSLEYRLVAEFWSLLLKMQFGRIAKLSGASEEAVRDAAMVIHGLEMRPARRFATRATEYVVPDFSVVRQDRELRFEYNDDREPRLRLARRYVEMLRNPAAFSREQVSFARNRYNRALMFLKAVESRRRTLRKLMKMIIELQPGFFENGPEHLHPATYRDAAVRIGVHSSTIARAAMGKYVETEYGIFPMRYFFRAGIGDKSRVSIKERIRQIIENEPPDAPLTDDVIEARLQADYGIRLSRRTVAKYRAELGIPGRSRRGKL